LLLTVKAVRVSQDEWTCAAISNVFEAGLYSKIIQSLDGLEWSEARQRFYKQHEVNLGGDPYFCSLFDDTFRNDLVNSLNLFFGAQLNIDFDVAAHKMVEGEFIDVHTDYNNFGETHRMTVTLNEDWKIENGGILLALNEDSISHVRDAWLPTANNGFIFEISEKSFHAVTPITGPRPRYSLIFTFKNAHPKNNDSPRWIPYVFEDDLVCARATGGHMGIPAKVFDSPYEFIQFETVRDLSEYIGGQLENAPSQWSYSYGNSMNVDLDGNQPKGSDLDRVSALGKLRNIPPIIVVRGNHGKYVLVDGSHRLSFAKDNSTAIGVAFFDDILE
jgi:hypothetical protein